MCAAKIDPNKPGFDVSAALDCAHASALAYAAADDPTKAAELAGSWGLTGLEPLPHEPQFGIALRAGQRVIVAFRGTTKTVHWRTNLNFLPKKTPWGLAHRGFVNAAGLFWPDLRDRIAGQPGQASDLFLTGHSLGAAIAVLTAAMVAREDGRHVPGVITFGQPPVAWGSFNRAFEDHFGSSYVRFVHDRDGVAEHPWARFEHVHADRYLKYIDVNDDLWEGWPLLRAFADAAKAPGKYGGLEMFKTHGMHHYIGALDAFASSARGS